MSTTWRKEIEEAMERAGDPGPLVHCTLREYELDDRFSSGYGCSEGRPFTAWTVARVYFPVVYDGAEWVESVPREPCSEAKGHVGGQ